MKAIVLVDIPDDYEEYGSGDWYITGDDLNIRYEEDGALMHYKNIKDDILKLKLLPNYKINSNQSGIYKSDLDRGYDNCLEELLGE